MTRQQRRREQHRQHRAAQAAPPGGDVAVMVGWCATEADLPEARQITHDNLVAMMGIARTGPVSWRWWSGDEAAYALDQLQAPGEDMTTELANYYRQIRGMLREYGGFVVMASAPGVQ